MGKEVLGVDIDEVVFPLVHHFALDHNARHGTELRPEQFKSYDFEHTLGLSVPETVDRVFAFVGSDHSHIDPLEGAQEAIDRLAGKFDIEVITARDSMFKTSTVEWLEEKIGKVFRNINFVGYAAILEKPLTKAEICQRIGAVAMVDDSIEYLQQCAEVGVDGVLFGDYPWNQIDKMPVGITRCSNWQGVMEYFNV